MDRLLSVLERQAENQTQHIERTAPKENPHYKADSIFLQPNGEQWAKLLKCDIYLGSIYYNDTPLTKAEVDALNQLQPLAKGVITKNDGGTLLVTVMPKSDAVGKLSRLTIIPYVAPGSNPTDARFEKNLNLTMPAITKMAEDLAKQAMVPA